MTVALVVVAGLVAVVWLPLATIIVLWSAQSANAGRRVDAVMAAHAAELSPGYAAAAPTAAWPHPGLTPGSGDTATPPPSPTLGVQQLEPGWDGPAVTSGATAPVLGVAARAARSKRVLPPPRAAHTGSPGRSPT